MINKKVLEFLKAKGYADRLTEHKETIDTVEHAAQQIGCSEAEIAKTLSFIVDEKPVIVVMAGDGRVNSSKFKALFHTKPSMIQRDQVEAITGFAPAQFEAMFISESHGKEDIDKTVEIIGNCLKNIYR